jgi:hypothetical protein
MSFLVLKRVSGNSDSLNILPTKTKVDFQSVLKTFTEHSQDFYKIWIQNSGNWR